MPSEIEIYGDILLFGVGVKFRSDTQRALNIALALYSDWQAPDDEAISIYVVLKSYGVNRGDGETHHVEGSRLAIDHDGISSRADGASGQGICEFAGDEADETALAEAINTVVLFLVAHRDRTPLHASAVLLDGVAVVFAGASGAGKSTLALAAHRAGWPVLSDDTVFVQTEPHFRLWTLGGPIHVFEKDAPPDAEGGLRLRAGRLKKSLRVGASGQSADRAVLCLLRRGEGPVLEPLTPADAIAALSARPEPGYEFYGERSAKAAAALVQEGAWHLTLSDDPAEAITLVRRTLVPDKKQGAGISFHRRYVALIAKMEERFSVMAWRSGDVDLWPLLRFDLYNDMYWENSGALPPPGRPWLLRLAGRALMPLVNLWRSRRDLAHFVICPRRADAVFLGDGTSLDRIDGAYQDRVGEPVAEALEKRGASIFMMQSGDLSRLPWRRPIFAANVMEARGWLLSFLNKRLLWLPDYDEAVEFLVREGISAPSFRRARLAARAARVDSEAFLFERLLKKVRPRMAFVVSFYAGLGPAFVLACRRRHVFCVALQHAPLEGAPMAYSDFSKLPDRGYATLPDLFWCWTQGDAAAVNRMVRGSPHHHGLHGGHPQLGPFLDDSDPVSLKWDREFTPGFGQEILVALQPTHDHRRLWDALADQIEAAPADWRWWIRRHPASRAYQDSAFGRLLSLRRPNVMIEKASSIPLPGLLRNMSAVLSLFSGAAAEGAVFGVPGFFLSEEARGPFGDLIDCKQAEIIPVARVRQKIAELAAHPLRPAHVAAPSLDQTLARLEIEAQEYTSR